MGWHSEEFGSSHEGTVGAVLADGSEPKPVYFDVGSGSHVPAVSDWWIYDGTCGAPRAAALRGSCSCGWRGTQHHPVDWAATTDLRDVDTDPVYNDWARHIAEVDARSVPLPLGLEGLLGQLDEQLDALTTEAPLAALRAVAILERLARRVGRDAAEATLTDQVSCETVGQALGMAAGEARAHLRRYRY
ncbi:hypothetical protein E1265_25520 [Streptomyces sp. 8K308]|uniref:hypothetical protein n=1 Tax=Streptomyces sp. 8K308 TaxID=2530388 RepID=UPI0010503997|nr:hypothetical protein [Streptomyces sp. 8K308]TDC18176.1 hypothetical protein E1265_25520 [Streptomyces sp. 8K308]